MAQVDVTTSIIIARPRMEVAAFAGNPANAPKWYVNIKSVEWKTPPPLREGSRVAFKARFLGKDLEYTYEVAEFVAGEKLVMRTSEGPFPMETTYRWETHDSNTTRMTLRNRGKPGGFSRLLAPVLAFAMRKANNNDLRRLKKLLEDPAAETVDLL